MTQLTQLLKTRLQENENRKFLKDISLNQWFTGKDVEDDIAIFQEAFKRNGLGSGDVVFMSLENSAVYIPMNQAMWRYGITAHPVAPDTPDAELLEDYSENSYPAMIFNRAKASVFMDRTELNYEELPLKTFPNLVLLIRKDNDKSQKSLQATEDSQGWILNTSGTTGKPKQVGLSHHFMYMAGQDDLVSHRMTEDDTVLIVMPMFHINAQELIIVSTLMSSGRIVVAPKFSASQFWNWIKDNDCTWTSVVPTIVSILLKNENSLASFSPNHKLRFVRCASAMLPIDRNREFGQRFGVPILEGYGMTESCSQCTLSPLDAMKLGSVGKPYGSEVKILDGNRMTSEAGIKGENVIRGPHVITDYLEPNPDSFKDGWLLTGDLGYFDEDGYLWLNGRRKNVINRGGEKINPTVIENAIGGLDYVKNIAAVALPDDIYGEIVAAAVILQTNVEANEQVKQAIMAHCQKHLIRYECPEEIYFVDDFPLNPTNKIIRPQLSQILIQQKLVRKSQVVERMLSEA